jgi:hypothetical protein
MFLTQLDALHGGVKLTSHLHQVSRLRMTKAVPSLPHTPTWGALELELLTVECGSGLR